jgi:hypothetical protein
MTINFPYLRVEISFSFINPRTFLRFWNTIFSLILSGFAFNTLSGFPVRTNVPKYFCLSLSKVDKPETAKLLAESPSVIIKVQSFDLFVPAYYASYNFVIFSKSYFLAFLIFLTVFL